MMEGFGKGHLISIKGRQDENGDARLFWLFRDGVDTIELEQVLTPAQANMLTRALADAGFGLADVNQFEKRTKELNDTISRMNSAASRMLAEIAQHKQYARIIEKALDARDAGDYRD